MIIRFATFATAIFLSLFCAISVMAQSEKAETKDWRKELGTLRVGVVLGHITDPSPTAKQRIEQGFIDILKMPVELVFTRDYPTLIEGQMSGRIEYAIYSSSAFATIHLLCKCVVPLVAPVAENGAEGLRAVMVARRATLKSLSGLSFQKIGLIDGNTLSGRQLALDGLTVNNVEVTGKEPYFMPVKNQTEGMAGLKNETLDGLIIWGQGNEEGEAAAISAINRLAEENLDAGAFDVIWQSSLLRFGPHAILDKIPPEARQALTNALTEMHNANPLLYELLDENLGGGFKPTSIDEYTSAIRMIAKLSNKK